VYLTGITVGLDPTATSRDAQQIALERGIQSRLLSRINCGDSFEEAADNCSSLSTSGVDRNDTKNVMEKISLEDFLDYRVRIPEVHVSSKYDCLVTSFQYSKGCADLINYTSNVESESGPSTAPSNGDDYSPFITGDVSQLSCDRKVKTSGEKGSSKVIKKIPPCGTSINWVRDVLIGSGTVDEIEKQRKRVKCCIGGTVEVTVAETGVLQGK
jgi:hypothetical protein